MSTQEKCCSIEPYFKIHEGKKEVFRDLCRRLVEKARQEEKCLYYGFSFNGNMAHCREGYEDAEGVLAHTENVGELLKEIPMSAEVVRSEIHGPEEELTKLREPLAQANLQFFTLEYGFRR